MVVGLGCLYPFGVGEKVGKKASLPRFGDGFGVGFGVGSLVGFEEVGLKVGL